MAEGSGAEGGEAGAAGEAWANAAGDSAGVASALSMLVTTGPGARPSVGAAAWAGTAAVTEELFCQKIAPNTATHSTIASVDAIAARRMSDLQTGAAEAQPYVMDRKCQPTPLIQA
jgi:hypothetical protein